MQRLEALVRTCRVPRILEVVKPQRFIPGFSQLKSTNQVCCYFKADGSFSLYALSITSVGEPYLLVGLLKELTALKSKVIC